MVFRSPDISSCTMFSMSMATFWVCTSASGRSSKCFSPGEKAMSKSCSPRSHWSHWSQPQGLRWAGILHRRICLTTRCLYRTKTMRALHWGHWGRLSCSLPQGRKNVQISPNPWNTLEYTVESCCVQEVIDDFYDMRISGIVNRIITGIIPDSLDAPSLKLKPMVIVSTSLYCVGKESGYRNNYDSDPLKDREVKSWH